MKKNVSLSLALLAAMMATATYAETPATGSEAALYHLAFLPPLPGSTLVPPLPGSASSRPAETPAEARAAQIKYEADLLILRKAETTLAKRILGQLTVSHEVELLRLNPDPRLAKDAGVVDYRYTADEEFAGGFKIVGRTILADRSAIGRLSAALEAGLAGSDGTSADCFSPRHALRFTSHGKIYLAVVCFECQQACLFEKDAITNGTTLLISRAPLAAFEEIFSGHGLPEKS